MDPETFFPKEIWERIIRNLTSTDDLLPAYNTCTLWRSFLCKNRAEWLFQGMFPSLARHLTLIDLLECRQVCKSWNKVIVSYLETRQPRIVSPGGSYKLCFRVPRHSLQVNCNPDEDLLNMSTVEVLQLFQTQFSAAGDEVPVAKNPFLSRSLGLYLREMGPAAAVLKVFEKFGVHLHCLDLSIIQQHQLDITPTVDIAKFVWNILRLVPNLKKLVLRICRFHDAVEMALNEEEENAECLDLEQYLKSNEVPHLPQLNNLSVYCSVEMMTKVLLAAYAPQIIKYVHISSTPFPPATNLSEFAWHFTGNYTENQLNSLRNIECPSLQRLHIYAVNLSDRVYFHSPTAQLFKTIETFNGSITQLYIFWGHFKTNFPAQFNLPFVQKFCIEFGRCRNPTRINFSFLRNLKSLRKLKCIFWESCYVRVLQIRKTMLRFLFTRESVDLQYYLNESTSGGPYKSNIWRKLPSLEKVKIQVVDDEEELLIVSQTKVYTRTVNRIF